ncbi:ferredoxin [Actinoplanes xinjiangensis]|uniref:ferredoxin n=1 Tax=Actinoplanes xinjiangensis TaxID=512350 RepID=UPI00342AEFC0
MQIAADDDKCIGAGQCVLTAPHVFDQRDDGVVVVLDEFPAEPDRVAARAAAAGCPVAAITVTAG